MYAGTPPHLRYPGTHNHNVYYFFREVTCGRALDNRQPRGTGCRPTVLVQRMLLFSFLRDGDQA